MTRPLVVYLAGPYRSRYGLWGVRQNIAFATNVARELWLMGYAVICPHANTAFMDSGDAATGGDTARVFLDGDLEFIRRSDLMVLLPGWGTSHGSIGEKALADELGLPVFDWPRDRALLESREIPARVVE
jgi:hypothetical protein